MRIVLLAQMDQLLGLHYAIALQRRGHRVTAVHVEEPRGIAEALPELRGVELLAPYRGGRKHPHRHYQAWAAADKLRGPLAPLGAAAARLLGGADRAAVQEAARQVAERDPEAVLATWGLNAYPEVLALQAQPGRRFPLLYDWNTYPLGDEPAGTPHANPLDRRLAEGLEGRVHASPRQQAHLRERMDLRRGVDVVFPDAFTELARPRGKPRRWSDEDGEPHVLYHGTWDVRPGGVDDVRGELRAIADAGIHVHFPAKGEPPRHPRLHPYAPLPMADHVRGKVFELGARCDAGLVLYHLPRPLARFQNFLPTRFLSSIACGLPVALPQGLLPPCEDVVREHGNGLLYASPADLRAQLADLERMAALRKAAEALEARFFLEARLGQLEDAMRAAAAALG